MLEPLEIQLPPFEEPLEYNSNYILSWNHVGLELNRLAHSLAVLNQTVPQTGPPNSARALGILHLAIHDAFFGIVGATIPAVPFKTYSPYLGSDLSVPPLPAVPAAPDRDPRLAVAGAAFTVLSSLYAVEGSPQFSARATTELERQLSQSMVVSSLTATEKTTGSFEFGVKVGMALYDSLKILGDELSQVGYQPKGKRYYFGDDPTNPIRLVPSNINMTEPNDPVKVLHPYHGPFYGKRARRFAVQSNNHIIADPPVGTSTTTNESTAEYIDSVRDVIRMGGAPALNTTLRTPEQTAGGHFWAYDGVNLIGTPPRLYNQILRQVAWSRKPISRAPTSDATNAEFARIFALSNVAMADAGIFAWREKYKFEFWRPLSGVREEPAPLGDPFWLTLGAPDTNTNHIHFKPPFPAYPSGHATFGAACFQAVRLYYGFAPNEPDNIAFDFVSDELNGINRDSLQMPFDHKLPITDQLGTVRTRVVRHFSSLWEAIFDNAISRIWLGVHWGFDAFAATDVREPAEPHHRYGGSCAVRDSQCRCRRTSNQQPSLYKLEEDGRSAYKDPKDIRYSTTGPRSDKPAGQQYPIGGVPLGLGIAKDIFASGLKASPASVQPWPITPVTNSSTSAGDTPTSST